MLARSFRFFAWLLTSMIVLAVVSATLAAVYPASHRLPAVTVGSAACALASWTLLAAGRRSAGREGDEGEDTLGGAESPSDRGEIADGSRLLGACYSLAAVMSQAEYAACELRDGTLRAIGELRGTLGGGRNLALEEIAIANDRMAALLYRIARDRDELVSSVSEATYSISRLDTSLQDMSRGGKELEASTDAVNRTVLEGTKVVEQLEKENEATIGSVKGAGAAVDELGRWSEEVGKIVEVIQDITDETNLLALNAAIIAAQAGEQGKAFAVVAEEIRGLAERTSSSTKEISDLVKAVEKSVADVDESMRKSLRSVERGDALVRDAGAVMDKVLESFESSRALAKEIAASTSEHRTDSTSVAKSMHKITEIAERLATVETAFPLAGNHSLTAVKVAEAVMVGSGSSQVRSMGAGAPIGRPEPSTIGAREEAVAPAEFALDAIRERVVSFVGVVERAAKVARSVARSSSEGTVPGATRCWELVGCSPEVQAACEARTSGDCRCFLMDRVACSLDKEDGAHGTRRCYDCRAFRWNLARLLSGDEEMTVEDQGREE